MTTHRLAFETSTRESTKIWPAHVISSLPLFDLTLGPAAWDWEYEYCALQRLSKHTKNMDETNHTIVIYTHTLPFLDINPSSLYAVSD